MNRNLAIFLAIVLVGSIALGQYYRDDIVNIMTMRDKIVFTDDGQVSSDESIIRYVKSVDAMEVYSPSMSFWGKDGVNPDDRFMDYGSSYLGAGRLRIDPSISTTFESKTNHNGGLSMATGTFGTFASSSELFVASDIYLGTALSTSDPRLYYGTSTPTGADAGDLWWDQDGDGSVLCDEGECYLAQYDGTNWDYYTTAGVLTDKFFSFRGLQGTSGKAYALNSGFLIEGPSKNDFDPAAVTFGDSNGAYAAHFYMISDGNDVDDYEFTITGTSITDTGTRTASDTEVLDFNTPSTNEFLETSKKWIGQISIERTAGPVSGGREFCYGFSKYWDNLNRDFQVKGVEANWLADKNDTSFDVRLIHYKVTSCSTAGDCWICNTGGDVDAPEIAALDDITPENDARAGEYGAWKVTNLATSIDGDGSEGIIVEIETSVSAAIDYGAVQLQIAPE